MVPVRFVVPDPDIMFELSPPVRVKSLLFVIAPLMLFAKVLNVPLLVIKKSIIHVLYA